MVGIYRKDLTLEVPTAHHRMILSIGGFSSAITVFLNGQVLCYAENGRTACEVDLTDAVRPGQNLLLLRVDEFSQVPISNVRICGGCLESFAALNCMKSTSCTFWTAISGQR